MSKKMQKPKVLFAKIEVATHDKLRMIAFQEGKSVAAVVREAVTLFIQKRKKSDKI